MYISGTDVWLYNDYHEYLYDSFSRDWMEGPWGSYDPDKVEGETGNYWRALYKLERQFSGTPSPMKIAERVGSGYSFI